MFVLEILPDSGTPRYLAFTKPVPENGMGVVLDIKKMSNIYLRGSYLAFLEYIVK